MKSEGRISVYWPTKGFGFLFETIQEDGKQKLVRRFFHIANVVSMASAQPEVGAKIKFTPVETPKGLAAVDLEIGPGPSHIAAGFAGVESGNGGAQ